MIPYDAPHLVDPLPDPAFIALVDTLTRILERTVADGVPPDIAISGARQHAIDNHLTGDRARALELACRQFERRESS